MPTPLDRALNSKTAFMAFTSIVGAVAVWSIWGQGDMFPPVPNPKPNTTKSTSTKITSSKNQNQANMLSDDPETWSEEEMIQWLDSRDLPSSGKETPEELLARVRSAMHAPT